MFYVYPCVFENPEEGGGFYVTFPDVPGALTGGNDRGEALEVAEDALTAALAGYVQEHRDIPVPSAVMDGQELVAVSPVVAAKLALYTAMRPPGHYQDCTGKTSWSERVRGPKACRPRSPFAYQPEKLNSLEPGAGVRNLIKGVEGTMKSFTHLTLAGLIIYLVLFTAISNQNKRSRNAFVQSRRPISAD